MTATTPPPVTMRIEYVHDIGDAYTPLLVLTCGETELCSSIDGSDPLLIWNKRMLEHTRAELRDLTLAISAWLSESHTNDDLFNLPLPACEEAAINACTLTDLENIEYLYKLSDVDIRPALCRSEAVDLHKVIGAFLTATNVSAN